MKCKPRKDGEYGHSVNNINIRIYGHKAEYEMEFVFEKDGIVALKTDWSDSIYMKKEDVVMYDIRLEPEREFYYSLADAQEENYRDIVEPDGYATYVWKVISWHKDIAELKADNYDDFIFIYKDQFLPTEKKERKKMSGIVINTKKTVNNMGVLGRNVTSVSGLQRDQLPDLYLSNDKGIVVIEPTCDIYYSVSCKSLLKKNKFYSEEEFQQALEAIREAGDLLHNINKELKAKREAWNCEETFVI